MYTNADQLTNKRDDLLMAIAHDKPAIIFITECLPKVHTHCISTALLALPGYNFFSNFDSEAIQEGTQGLRGVCIYVNEDIQASEVSFATSHLIEQLWISIRLKDSDLLTAGCLYRSPSCNAHQSVNELEHLLHSVLTASPSHILISGDFNVPQIDWSSSFCSAPELHFAHRFLDTIHNCMLFQHVTQPTRFRDGETANTLDLLFTNEEGMLTNLEYCPGLGKSDHIVMRFEVTCYTCLKQPEKVRLNFRRANWADLNDRLSRANWQSLTTLDVQSGYELFCQILRKAVAESIPLARCDKVRKNMYMTSQALKLKKRKKFLWSKYISTLDVLDLARFKECRNRLRALTRRLRQSFEQSLVSDIKQNPKAFWRYSNSRLKTKPVIGHLRHSVTGELEDTNKGKADILNSFFASTFTHEEHADKPVLSIRDSVPEITDVDISPDSVELKLRVLNPCSAAGPDEIHPHVLREARHALCTPLALLYRRSLDTGAIPNDWKLGSIVPIYKKGDKKDPGNYRPVSLTAVTCKVMESLIRDELLKHLSDSCLLSHSQHGFRPKRSCNTQLIEVIEHWSTALENHSSLDVLYLDFQKAFDSVPHQRLLHKLQCYGVKDKILAWIDAFLIDRRQRVVLQGCSSDWSDVVSGVPQGSVLGPLLFLLYVNDLPDVVSGHISMFADDTKLYSTISTPHDSTALQADLEALVGWTGTWQLPLNTSKCKVLHMGRANQNLDYTMYDAVLASVQVEKDLGVYIDTELKFRQHAAAVVAKANRVLAVIRRSFALMTQHTLPLLFKSLVRPHLEYGNLIWGPFNRADQKLVEKVQRRATRMIDSIRHLPYEERLRRLQLPSLYYRRKRGDMIFMYQLFHSGVDLDPEDFFTIVKEGTTRGHPFKVHKPRATCRVRRFAFSVRVVNSWNGLPATVVCSPSLASFKANLDAHWAHMLYSLPVND